MAAETATLPLNITISMGDVSFSLTPSTTEQPSSSSGVFRRSPSPPPRSNKASPSSQRHRRPPLRSNNYDVVNSSSRTETTSSSPPTVSIRQQGAFSGYFIDLQSFTGTLQIIPSKQSVLAQAKSQTSYSPLKRAASSQNSDDSITKRRVKKRSLTPVKNRKESEVLTPVRNRKESEVLTPVRNRKESEVLTPVRNRNESDAVDGIEDNSTKRSVQFSLPTNKDMHGSGKNRDNNDNEEMVRKEDKDLTTSPIKKQNNRNSSSSPVPEKQSKAKSILPAPPPSLSAALASTPPQVMQATAKIARETSSALARSSKFALKQIALAGKDAFDKLHGDAPPNYSAHINELSQEASFDSLDDATYDAIDGTEYHYACASDNLEEIRRLLDDIEGDSLFYLWKTDCGGKLPLHVLTENVQLIEEDPVGCEEVAISMIELMGPANLVYALSPNSSWAPFISTLGRWTEKLHRGTSLKTGTASGNDQSPSRDISASTTQSRTRRVSYFPLFGSTMSNTRSQTLMTNTDKLMYLPVNVKVTHHVLWSIRMLSRLIDEYPEQTREFIMTNLATVPLFLKSVLLISNFDEMQILLETSLVTHAVLDKRSINVWLIAMLTSNRESRYRAVTFIKLLSRLTLVDLVNSSTSSDRFSDAEIERFVRNREETFTCIRNLPGLFPAVLALGKGLETLSTSRVLRYVTASTIRKSISFFVLLLDFFYAIFLLMGYRLHVEFALSHDSVDGPINYRDYKFLSIPMNFISGYFLLKEGITVLSLYLTSETLARRYCTSWGNILDVASAVMVLSFGTTLLHNSDLLENQGFVASITMMLLWLRIINQYRIMNSSFALFIYSVKEVIRQIKWFLLFLMAIVFMFSDAARAVVAARGDCWNGTLIDDPYIQEYCGDGFIATTVRMYSVLVGDVSLEYFQSSGAMVTVFVFFSFFSIIILFNILIAIIISAYESTKERTREIFGRARVEYAAHLIARKQFMSPTETSDFHIDRFVPRWVRKCVRAAYFVISACALFAVEYGFAGAVYYLMLEYDKDMIRSLMIVYVSAGAAFNAYIMSVAVTTLFSKYEQFSPSAGGKVVKRLMRCVEKAVTLFHQLLGFNEDMALDLSDDVDEVKFLGSE